jgi:hypothetical protein
MPAHGDWAGTDRVGGVVCGILSDGLGTILSYWKRFHGVGDGGSEVLSTEKLSYVEGRESQGFETWW